MAIINPHTRLIARSAVRKIVPFTYSNPTNLKLKIVAELLKAGWQNAGENALECVPQATLMYGNQSYYQKVKIELGTDSNTIYFTISDGQNHLASTSPLRLTGVLSGLLIISQYQLIIVPMGATTGNYTHILISCLKFPPFLVTDYFNAILACEAHDLLTDWDASMFQGRSFCSLIDKNLNVAQWTAEPFGTTPGTPKIIAIGTDSDFGVFGSIKLKSPTWVMWGLGSQYETPKFVGFLWDLLFFFRNDLTVLSSSFLDRRKYFNLRTHFNNSLCFEYSSVLQDE